MGFAPAHEGAEAARLIPMSATEAQEVFTVREFVQRFSSTPRGARLARRLAAHRLDQWGVPYGSTLSEAVTLIVAELAANSVRHGRIPGRDFELRLCHDREAGVLRVEVADTHPGLPHSSPPYDGQGDAEGGRGLLLVDALAGRWGVTDRQGPGKSVWADCAWPGPHGGVAGADDVG
jgi:anti-sigma regulatory factor (Ser/Thr protein kinase)